MQLAARCGAEHSATVAAELPTCPKVQAVAETLAIHRQGNVTHPRASRCSPRGRPRAASFVAEPNVMAAAGPEGRRAKRQPRQWGLGRIGKIRRVGCAYDRAGRRRLPSIVSSSPIPVVPPLRSCCSLGAGG